MDFASYELAIVMAVMFLKRSSRVRPRERIPENRKLYVGRREGGKVSMNSRTEKSSYDKKDGRV